MKTHIQTHMQTLSFFTKGFTKLEYLITFLTFVSWKYLAYVQLLDPGFNKFQPE